jgi:hypothetical protein
MQGELTFMIAVDLIPQYSSQLITATYITVVAFNKYCCR